MQRFGKSFIVALFIVAGSIFATTSATPTADAAPAPRPLSQRTETITLTPMADAYVISSSASSNFGTEADLLVSSLNTVAVIQANTLIHFDLNKIPAGSIIERATLTLYQRDASGEAQWPLAIGRITENWSETAVTFRTAPTTEQTGLVFVSPNEADVTAESDITALVRQWRYQPFFYPNNGLMLSGTSFNAGRQFGSREGRVAPVLTVDFTPPPTSITIPHVTDVGKLDAICDTQNEYANALSYQYIDHLGAISTLYLKQDDEFLYACIEGAQGSFTIRYFSLYLDRNNGSEKYADIDDLSLQVRVEDGAMSPYEGTGQSINTWVPSAYTNWRAVAKPTVTAAEPEVAEYLVPLTDLTTTCGQPFGLALFHHWVTDSGVDYGWPTVNSSFSPDTWVQATLERTTCPIRVCWESATDCQAANTATVHKIDVADSYAVDRAGYVLDRDQIADGTQIWAMVPVSEAKDYTLYYTSGAPQTVDPAAYDNDPAGEMTLVVSERNPLMLHNLDISAQWNIEGDANYKAELRNNILLASQQFYDFTNGQMALGTVTVHQNYEAWDDADVWLFANNNLRPEADIGGMVETETVDPFWDGTGDKHKLVYEPGRAYMGATWNRFGLPGVQISVTNGVSGTVDTSGDWAAVFAHELGHYLLFLDDTYFRFRNDFVIESVYSCTGSAMGWVYFDENTEFVHDDIHWNDNCLHTSHNDQLARDEWATMQLWYPWLTQPVDDAGPGTLPAALTNVNFIAPTGAPNPLVNQLFALDYRDGETASQEARAVIFRNNRVIDQGKPIKGSTEILLHGAQEGDRLCLIDINDNAQDPDTPRNQYGCEKISAGDNTLFLEKNSAWAPVMLIDPITPTIPGGTSLVISVTQPVNPGTVLKARIYPEHMDEVKEVSLSGEGNGFSGRLDLPFTPAAYVQLWVDENEAPDGTDPRREAIIDFGVGGGGLPGPKSQVGFAPIISSSDGRAFFIARAGITLQTGEFIALQSMAGTPPLPANSIIVDQAYRLIAYPASLVQQGSINLRFDLLSPLQAATVNTTSYQLHFWDDGQWIPLETTVTTEPNGGQLASATSQGDGIYALLQMPELSESVYLPMVHK